MSATIENESEKKLKFVLDYIQENNLTAYKIAKETGISAVGISKIVKNEVTPQSSTIENLFNYVSSLKEQNSIGSRIEQLILYLGKNKSSFSNIIGLSNNVTIGRIIKENRKPSFDVLSKIIEKYPRVNPTWLLTGEGEMIKESNTTLDQLSLKELAQLVSTHEHELMEVKIFTDIIEKRVAKKLVELTLNPDKIKTFIQS